MDVQSAFDAASAAWGVSDLVQIASGGQKIVARGKQGPEEVVLKLVHLSTATGDVELERCRREVALLKSIDNPHVVRVLTDLEVLGNPPQGAMWLEQCLDGDDLAASLNYSWTWDATAEFLTGVSSGLQALHAARSVHRDLSPRNIRRTSTGWVIMDPGLAKHLERSSITGMFDPGTPGYMSPEHLTPGVRLGPAADIFSLGILGYQALTGQPPVPFNGDFSAYQFQLTNQQAPSVGGLRPDLEPVRVALIDRCLNRQPARRFLDAAEFLTALAGL